MRIAAGRDVRRSRSPVLTLDNEDSSRATITFDRHLRLNQLDLDVDPRRRSRRAFVSHAHSDHLASHDHAYCSVETKVLARQRQPTGNFQAIPWDESINVDGSRIRLAPAGHILGAAQLVVEPFGGGRLVYTGDLNLRRRTTTPAAEIVECDTLVIETTFGHPRYRWPSDEESVGMLLEAVRQSIKNSQRPIVVGYALGKAQELAAILIRSGFRVGAEPSVKTFCDIYRELGTDVGEVASTSDGDQDFDVLVASPSFVRGRRRSGRGHDFIIWASGWAIDRSFRYRMGADVAIPFSDHADFDQLIEYVERARPSRVYTMHGTSEFARQLRSREVEAEHLGRHQMSLFD